VPHRVVRHAGAERKADDDAGGGDAACGRAVGVPGVTRHQDKSFEAALEGGWHEPETRVRRPGRQGLPNMPPGPIPDYSKKKDVGVFACLRGERRADRLSHSPEGIWTEFKGDRRHEMKADPRPSPGLRFS